MSSTSIYSPIKKSAHNIKTFEQYKIEIEEMHKDSGYIITGFVGDWKNIKTKMIVECPIHGEWRSSTAASLKCGAACPECSYITRSTKAHEKAKLKFVHLANEIHNNQYDYSQSVYLRTNTKVKITCYMHGTFEQSPAHHLSGKGCSLCANEMRGIRANDKAAKTFITKAGILHDNIYTYEKVVYIDSKSCVFITCPTHGDFLQSPNSHLSGCGCPSCAKTGFKKDICGFLYLLKIRKSEQESVVGYGISNNPNQRLKVHQRNCRIAGYDIDTCHLYRFIVGKYAANIELRLKQTFPAIPNITIHGFITENSHINNYIKIKEFVESHIGCESCLLDSDFKLYAHII